MINFSATYFDGISSKAIPVEVSIDHEWLKVVGLENEVDLQFVASDCSITPPLGTSYRSLLLPDGGRCETEDQKGLKHLEKQQNGGKIFQLVDSLERRWGLVLCCLVALVISVYLFSVYGIPKIAEKIAYNLPLEINEKVTSKVIDILDKNIFEPSGLFEGEQDTIRQLFADLIKNKQKDFTYQLEFRHSDAIGPNAFALPSGLVILTDQMLELLDHDEELRGVLVHEIAHIENRHGMRSILQSTGVFFLISVLVGDVASITSTAATLPTVLLETGYSRTFEREADEAVGLYYTNLNQTTVHYQNMLAKLGEISTVHEGLGFLSTHPLTEERILRMQQFDKRLKSRSD